MSLEVKINPTRESNVKAASDHLWYNILMPFSILGSVIASSDMAIKLYRSELLSQDGHITMLGYIIPAFVFTVGRLMDKISTVEAFKVVSEADMLGVKHGLSELNPLLPRHPTEKDLFSKRLIGLESLFVPLVIIFPPFGISVGVGSLVAAASNEANRRGLQRKLAATLTRIPQG